MASGKFMEFTRIPSELLLQILHSCNYLNFYTFGFQSGIMKKKLSAIGILFMLVLKHPPMPEFSLFQKHHIVEVRCFSIKKIALEFFMN